MVSDFVSEIKLATLITPRQTGSRQIGQVRSSRHKYLVGQKDAPIALLLDIAAVFTEQKSDQKTSLSDF